MSIKSTNINPVTLPTPPSGYSYILTDLSGDLAVKLDTGVVVYPTGVDELSALTDVSLSGQTSGQALIWSGSIWENADVITDLSNYYTSGQTDTIISTEISIRTSVDSSLSTAIVNVPQFNPSGLTASLSSEISIRSSSDLSLSTAISTETSTRTADDLSLSTAVSTNTSQNISLSISLSSEISVRGSADLSLSTGLSRKSVV